LCPVIERKLYIDDISSPPNKIEYTGSDLSYTYSSSDPQVVTAPK
jgi:hypothetical protein